MDTKSDKAIIIFDGVCNFCDHTVRFVMDRDRDRRFLFASNESQEGSALLHQFGVDPSAVESVYLVEGDRIWAKSAATIEIAKRMRWPWKLGYLGKFIPRFLRDWLYDLIARNRYRFFGKRELCRLPTESERERFLA